MLSYKRLKKWAITFLVCVCFSQISFAQFEGYSVDKGFYESRGHTIGYTFISANLEEDAPVLILIHGSDSLPRDNWWFIEKSKQFLKLGTSVMLYDKVGTGESSGVFSEMPYLEDAARDVINGAVHLKSNYKVGKIGLWGISQGGWIGPLAASKSNLIDYVMAVSGPTVTPQEQVIYTRASDLRHDGHHTTEEIEAVSEYRRKLYTYFGTGVGFDKITRLINREKQLLWWSKFNFRVGQTPPSGLYKRNFDFYRKTLFDPTEAISKTTVPILFVYGDQDPLVPVEKCTKIIEGLIARGMNNLTYQVFENAGHGIEDISEGGANHDASNNENEDHTEMMKKVSYRKEYLQLENDWVIKHIK